MKDQGAKVTEMSALIVAQPGPLRNSLHGFLSELPQIETVRVASDAFSAAQIVRTSQPTLMLLDTHLPTDEALTALKTFKAMGKGQCLVLADDTRQQRRAQVAGADVALLKGYPAEKLAQVIEDLALENTD